MNKNVAAAPLAKSSGSAAFKCPHVGTVLLCLLLCLSVSGCCSLKKTIFPVLPSGVEIFRSSALGFFVHGPSRSSVLWNICSASSSFGAASSWSSLGGTGIILAAPLCAPVGRTYVQATQNNKTNTLTATTVTVTKLALKG